MIKDKYWGRKRYLDKTTVEFVITMKLRHHTRRHLRGIIGVVRKRLKARSAINVPLMLNGISIKKVEPKILFTEVHPKNTPEHDRKLKDGELKR